MTLQLPAMFTVVFAKAITALVGKLCGSNDCVVLEKGELSEFAPKDRSRGSPPRISIKTRLHARTVFGSAKTFQSAAFP